MSEAVSALNGATYHGYCTVTDTGLRGMVTIRGDLGDGGFAKAVKAVTGMALPGQGEIIAKGAQALAWMSPDELLLFCPYDDAQARAVTLADKLESAHALAANVSDARAVFRVDGPACREVIAKLSPADVSPAAFGPGRMRRTRLAQVAGAFHMPDETSFEVIAFRSVGAYVFELLSTAAKDGGQVGVFSAP